VLKLVKNILVLVVFAVLLAACGSGGGAASSAAAEKPVAKPFEPMMAELAAEWLPIELPVESDATVLTITTQFDSFLLSADGFIVANTTSIDDSSGDVTYRSYFGYVVLADDVLSGELSFVDSFPGPNPVPDTGKVDITIVAADLENMSGSVDMVDDSSLNFALTRGNDLVAVASDSRLPGIWDGGATNQVFMQFLGNPYPFGLEFDNNGVGFGSFDSVCALNIDFQALLETPSNSQGSTTGTHVMHQIAVSVTGCQQAAEYYGIGAVVEPFSGGATLLTMFWANSATELAMTAMLPPT